MRKLFVLFLGILFSADAEVAISVDNFQDNGDGTATIEVYMQNTEPVAGFQFNMINGNAEYDSGESYYDYGADGRNKIYEKFRSDNGYFSSYGGCFGCTEENDLDGDGRTSEYECQDICNGQSSCCVSSVGGAVLSESGSGECYSANGLWIQYGSWGGECLDFNGNVVEGFCESSITDYILFEFDNPQDCHINGHEWNFIDYEYECRSVGVCSDGNTNYSGICFFTDEADCSDDPDYSSNGYCVKHENDEYACSQEASGQWYTFSGYNDQNENICENRGECIGDENLNNWQDADGNDLSDDIFSEYDSSPSDVLQNSECKCTNSTSGPTGYVWDSFDQDWYGNFSWNPYSTPDDCAEGDKLWQYANQDPSNDDYKYRCSSGISSYINGACYTDETYTELAEARCVNTGTNSIVEGVDEECCSDLSANWRECDDRITCTSESNGCGGYWVQISQVSGDPNVTGYWDPDCPACNLPSDVDNIVSCSAIDQLGSDLEDCVSVCDDAQGAWIGSDQGTEKNEQYDKGEIFIDSPIIEFGFGDDDAGSIVPSDWQFSLGGNVILAFSLNGTTIEAQDTPTLLLSLTFDYSADDIGSDKIFVYGDDICKGPGQTGAGNCLSELAFSGTSAQRLATYFEPSVIDVASGVMTGSQCGDGICSPKFSCYDGDDLQAGYKDFSDCISAGYEWQYDENVDSCPDDCDSFCGDMYCDFSAGEDYGTCGADCLPSCGDGVCSTDVITENGSENSSTCPADCGESFCGDHYCDDTSEDSDNCATDCYNVCGDQVCDSGENYGNCSADCENLCEDFYCSEEEENGTLADASCLDADGEISSLLNALDCSCGNGQCERDLLGENYLNCPLDCESVCGDGLYDINPDDRYECQVGGEVNQDAGTEEQCVEAGGSWVSDGVLEDISCLADYSPVCGDGYCDQRCVDNSDDPSIGGQCVDGEGSPVFEDSNNNGVQDDGEDFLDYDACKNEAFLVDPNIFWSFGYTTYSECIAAEPSGGWNANIEAFDSCPADCSVSFCGDGYCDRDGDSPENFENCDAIKFGTSVPECKSICGDNICDQDFSNFVCYIPIYNENGSCNSGYLTDSTLTQEECYDQGESSDSCSLDVYWGPVENGASCGESDGYCYFSGTDTVSDSIASSDDCASLGGVWNSGDCGVVCGDNYCDLAGGEMYRDNPDTDFNELACSTEAFYCIGFEAGNQSDCESGGGGWVSGDCSPVQCGDGECNAAAGEDASCAADCVAVCGDGYCSTLSGEDSVACSNDQNYCYILLTQEQVEGVDEVGCDNAGGIWAPGDCYCGDGVCDQIESVIDADGDGVIDDGACLADTECWLVPGDGLCVTVDGEGESVPYCENNLTEAQCDEARGGRWDDSSNDCLFVNEPDCAYANSLCEVCTGEWFVGSSGDCVSEGDGICTQLDVDNGILMGEASVADDMHIASSDCFCGNGFIDFGEDLDSCTEDAAWCGDGLCSNDVGEKFSTCYDCVCGDGVCDSDEDFALVTTYCNDDCCGDGVQGYHETSQLALGVNVCEADLSVDGSVPTRYALEANYPNPFNPVTSIRYSVKSPGNVTITIYDALGRVVHKLVDDYHAPGAMYEVQWNSDNQSRVPVSTGLYFYEMVSGDFVDRKKMTIIK